jgi:outer membrane protein insertion porin family
MGCEMLHKKLIGALFFAAFVSVLFVSTAAQQGGKLVESVDIQGNRRLTDEELLKFVKTRPGDRYEDVRVQQDLQSLNQTGQFDSTANRVVVEEGARGGVYIIFEVKEMPVITEVHFTGLHYASEDEILGQLRERRTVVEINEPYNPTKVRKVAGIIREYLAKRGYPDATVFVTEEEVSATSLTLTFRIDELPDVDEDACEECDSAHN